MQISAVMWLVAIPLVATPVAYFAGHTGRAAASESGGQTSTRLGALIALLAAFYPFSQAVRELAVSGPSTFAIGLISLRADGLALLMSGLALVLGIAVVLSGDPTVHRDGGEARFYALLLIMLGSAIGLVNAGDLFNLWLWFETMAIASYLLVAFHRDQPATLEASVKYLVQNSAGSALVILGIALVFAQTGTLDLQQIRANATASPGLLAAGALFLIGFGVKAALVPLHTWLPDAYSQAPSGVSAILSGVVTEAGLVAVLRALSLLSGSYLAWGTLLIGFGAVNMLVGNLMALRQQQVKRLLAYSSLTHIGYMLLGLGIGVYAGQLTAAQGSFFHLINHGLMKGLAFLAAGALLQALFAEGSDPASLTITDLDGAAQRYPMVALVMSIALLGLGGLPPLAGFMSEWQIFTAGFLTRNGVIEGMVVFAGLMSVMSLTYYVPVVNAIYRKRMSETVRSGAPIQGAMLVPLLLLAAAVIAIGVWPQLMQWLTAPAGTALLTGLGK